MLTATKLPQVTTTATSGHGNRLHQQKRCIHGGAGYLNVPAASNNSAKATLPATSPSAQFNFFTQTLSLVTGTGAIWVPALFGAML
jgi:hypothetical protein